MLYEHYQGRLLQYSSGFPLGVSSAGGQLELLFGCGFLLIHFPAWPTTFLSGESFIYLFCTVLGCFM